MFTYLQSLIQTLIAMVMALTTTLPVNSPAYLAKYGGHCLTPPSPLVTQTQKLLVNGSFENGTDANDVPNGWQKIGTIQHSDVVTCDQAHSGSCSFYFGHQQGEFTGYVRRITQNVAISGFANTNITLTGWSKAENVTQVYANRPWLLYAVDLVFYDNNGVALPTPNSNERIVFPGGIHDFTKVERTFTPGVDFHCFDIGVTFYEKGEAWFDDIGVTLSPQ